MSEPWCHTADPDGDESKKGRGNRKTYEMMSADREDSLFDEMIQMKTIVVSTKKVERIDTDDDLVMC
jgi:hypothetical protein